MQRTRIIAAIAAALAFAACAPPGEVGVQPPPPDAAAVEVGANLVCPGDTSGMQAEVFAQRCAGAGCHGAVNPALGLDLVSPGLEARLLGAPSIGCRGERLLVAGDPEHSELYRKVASASPECGGRMPVAPPYFDAGEVECLRRWISQLTPLDAGAPASDAGTPADAAPEARPPDVAPPGCPSGHTACVQSGTMTCKSLLTDPANCGGCGRTCSAGTVCSAGTCVKGACPTGTLNCTGACVNTATDPANCGACGRACGAGATCVASACVVTCASGTFNCGGTCVNTASDPRNCGGCGKVCASGESCLSGTCVGCGPTVSFSGQIQPIFNAGCTTNCHSGNRPAGGLALTAGVAHAELYNVTSTCAGKKHVAPRSPQTSYLINKLTGVDMCSGGIMPKADGRLSAAQIDLLRSWICQGAPNN